MTDWRTVEGGSKPVPVDSTSSASTVYETRNAHEIEREDMDGQKTKMWEWEERTFTKEEYAVHLANELKENMRSNEVSIEDLSMAIIELAELIGG